MKRLLLKYSSSQYRVFRPVAQELSYYLSQSRNITHS